MLPAPPPTPITRTPAQRHAIRVRRFAMASATYGLGLCILGLCSALGLFPRSGLAQVAALFFLINLGLAVAFWQRWNEFFADPSMTALQISLAVTMVAVILVLGRDVQFLASPFYSVLFVFGMLQLRARQLAGVAAYVVASYGVAMLLRHQLYGSSLDMRVEAVIAALVVGSSVWFAAAAIYIANLRARLSTSMQHIAKLATHDGLTGLRNRRQLDLELESALAQADERGQPLCIVMVDVDHFKAINDQHGHAVGDAVLVCVAACLASAARAGETVGRYGGEEFLVVLPGAWPHQAVSMAERLRGLLLALQPLPGASTPVTASFGVAGWRPGDRAADLLHRADQALYRAKAAGRNRVEVDAPLLA